MFDIYTHKTDTAHITKTVHEHRAPTDESVKLLREMEAKARDEVIKTINVRDTLINGALHHMKLPMSGNHRFRFIYSINGEKMTTDYDVDEYDLEIKKSNDWIGGLINAVAVDIAGKVLQKPFAEMYKRGDMRGY